jgi:hypothetical protein
MEMPTSRNGGSGSAIVVDTWRPGPANRRNARGSTVPRSTPAEERSAAVTTTGPSVRVRIATQRFAPANGLGATAALRKGTLSALRHRRACSGLMTSLSSIASKGPL